jgi:hypothetical protein
MQEKDFEELIEIAEEALAEDDILDEFAEIDNAYWFSAKRLDGKKKYDASVLIVVDKYTGEVSSLDYAADDYSYDLWTNADREAVENDIGLIDRLKQARNKRKARMFGFFHRKR